MKSPFLGWLDTQGIVIQFGKEYPSAWSKLRNNKNYFGLIDQKGGIRTSNAKSQIEAAKEAIIISFGFLETRYLRQMIS